MGQPDVLKHLPVNTVIVTRIDFSAFALGQPIEPVPPLRPSGGVYGGDRDRVAVGRGPMGTAHGALWYLGRRLARGGIADLRQACGQR